MERHGIRLIAISYDPPEVLRQFSVDKGIRFPLLSDAGSRVITELGLLDRDLVEHHAAFGIQTRDFQLGVAYPSILVLDEAGRIVGKRIGENYRAREGAMKLVDEALGIGLPPAGPRKVKSGPHVEVTAVTDSPLYVRWQETRLHVIFDVDSGWHVYGRPIPMGYVAVDVELRGIPELAVHAAEYPPVRPFRIEGLDEDFNVYDGHFEIVVPFAVKVAAGYGEVNLRVAVAYQSCRETECLPPVHQTIEMTLDEASPA